MFLKFKHNYHYHSLLYKNSIFKSIKDSAFFLFVAFFNAFMPIFLCMITAFIKPYGAQAVMGVGYVAAFLLTFSQVGIAFATSTYFLTKNKVKQYYSSQNDIEAKIMSRSISISVLMGIILTIIYCISSYLYMKYSCNRPNTIQTLDYGIDFMYTSFCYILFVCLNFLLILYLKMKQRHLATIIQSISFLLMIIFPIVFGIFCKMEAKGIGLGCSLAAIITFLIIISVIIFKYPIKIKYIFVKYNFNDFRDIITESVAGIAVSFFKGIGILILALALPVKLKDFVPLSYQMARLIWFNLMYSVVWFAVGLGDTIKFYTLNDDSTWDVRVKIKWFHKLLIVSFSVTLIFCIGSWFLIEPLAKLYIQNDNYASYLQTPPFPVELKNLIANTQNIFNKHIPELVGVNNESERIEIIFKWINENYNSPLGRLKILKLIEELVNNADVNDIKIFVNYIVQYKGFTSLNSEVIVSLLNHNFNQPDFLIALALQNYNSNSSFYIFVYALLCSIWTILMPANKNVTKKGMSNLFVTFVYAFAIGFIIGFGTYYSLINNKEGNTFRYLDAWTFPLMIIAILVAIVIVSKWVLTIIKLNHHLNHDLHQFIQFLKSKKLSKWERSLLIFIYRNNSQITIDEIYKYNPRIDIDIFYGLLTKQYIAISLKKSVPTYFLTQQLFNEFHQFI